jgi:hypothetical protein
VSPTLQHSATIPHVNWIKSINTMHTMSLASDQSSSTTASDQPAAAVAMSHHSPEELRRGMLTHQNSTDIKLVPSTAQQSNNATTPPRHEEDIDDNPHSHFLSPVYMYESWDDSDGDSDDGSLVEFDAGITDFALFNDDYQHAKEHNLPLSDKWNDFVEGQAECLDRAVARTRAERNSFPAGPLYSGSTFGQHETVPSLTPDVSPRLADDLEYDSSDDNASNRPYSTKIVTPDSQCPASAPIDIPARRHLSTVSECAIEDDDFADPAAPAFLLYRHSQRPDKRKKSARPQPAPMRPGMSAGSRTLSGKLHVWRRPSWGIFMVDEEREREEEAMREESAARGRDGTLRKMRGRRELRG